MQEPDDLEQCGKNQEPKVPYCGLYYFSRCPVFSGSLLPVWFKDQSLL